MLTMIPLNRLTLAEGNVRRSGSLNIDELAASILAHGLIQNLTVRPLASEAEGSSDRYEVFAGGRRLRALQQLVKARKLKKDHPVACRVLDGFSATEIGLAENVFQLPMHPHDQYLAFAKLHDEGQAVADIAARFGVSERIVEQRLKLGRVSPNLLAFYRDGAITLDTLMAFTVSNDYAEQERVWHELPAWNRHPETIRRALTATHLAARDRLARFIGLEAYEAAGGAILRDLFDEKRCWLTDPALVQRLAAERLEAEAATLRDEGWKWVLVGTERPVFQTAARVYPTHRDPTEAERTEMDRLGTRLGEIEVVMAGEGLGEDEAQQLVTEHGTLDAALQTIHARLAGFTEEDKARAGCLVHIDPVGGLAVDRGLVRDEDRTMPASGDPATEAASATPPPDIASMPPCTEPAAGEVNGVKPLAAGLTEELTAYRTVGLRVALAQRPDVALLALTHALACEIFGGFGRGGTCLNLRVIETYLDGSAPGIDDSPAGKALAEARRAWGERVPRDSKALWDWLVAQDDETRQMLLAFCLAVSVDALVSARPSSALRPSDPAQAGRLAATLALDMATWWRPTREGFLDRASKAQILAAVAEAAGEEKARSLDGLKKDALAELAEPILIAANWLPDALRTPAEKGETTKEAEPRLQAA